MEQLSQQLQIISGFTRMSAEMLIALISKLNLHMTPRDLTYCQNQYRLRERREPTEEELHFLDALYTARIGRIESYGLRAFYTSDPIIAETYADMIAKANHTKREERPYTPAELSGVITKSLCRAGKKISVPSLCVGSDAPLRSLRYGRLEIGSATLHQTTAIIADKHDAVPHASTPPQATDHLILLTPADLSPSAFAERIAMLALPEHTEILPIGEHGLLEALLHFDGVYLVPAYLPENKEDTVLSDWVSSYKNGVLLRLDGEIAASVRDRAVEHGLIASIIGKCTSNHFLTVRRKDQSPVQWETDFLRAFFPVLPADVEISHIGQNCDIHVTAPQEQTICAGGDCTLLSADIPNTAYAIQKEHILTGAVSYPFSNKFLSALYTTLHAVNRAVAAGVSYEALTLSNQLSVVRDASVTGPLFGDLMASLLGAYRAQSELAIPDIGGSFYAPQADQHGTLTVFAAAPTPQKVIPTSFTSSGNNVYLLKPLIGENGLPDFEDYRKLLQYVHRLCQDGIVRSAIAVDAGGILTALHTMAHSGYGLLSTSALPSAICGFLIETSEIIQGTLLGVTSATPLLRIHTEDIPIVSYRFPHISEDQVPMSLVGVDKPILCLAQTSAVGCEIPLRHWVEKHQTMLKTIPVSQNCSRAEMTALANTIRQSNIAIYVGAQDMMEKMRVNLRVAYAEKELLSRGGLILCIHTDTPRARNEMIPSGHPIFYRLPAVLYERFAIQFEGENKQIVHICGGSAAIPHMLASAIAYFQ